MTGTGGPKPGAEARPARVTWRGADVGATARPVPPDRPDEIVGPAPRLAALYRRALSGAGGRASRARATVVAGAAVVLSSVSLIVVAAVTMLVAGVAGRLLLRGTRLGETHPILAGAAAWVTLGAEVILVAYGWRAWLRRHPVGPMGPGETVRAAAAWPRRPRSAPPLVRPLARLMEWAGYAGVSLLLLWPATLHLSDTLAGSGDMEVYMWQGWRLAQLMHQGVILPLSIPDVIWPYGTNLLLGDGLLPEYVSALWNLVAPPILALNLALVTGVMLNIAAGRHLAKVVSNRRMVWAISGLAFATAPVVALRLDGHFTLTYSFAVALLVAEGLRVARDNGRVRWLRTGLLLYIAYLCSIDDLLFAAIAFAVIVLAAQRRWRLAAGQLARIIVAGILCLALMLPFLIPHVALERAELAHGGTPALKTEAYLFSADLMSIAAAPVHERTVPLPTIGQLYVRPYPNELEATIFPGYLAFAGLGLLLWIRSRLRIPLLLAGAVTWLLALGTSLRVSGLGVMVPLHGVAQPWLPFSALLEIPGLGSLRTPDRAGFTLAAIATAMIALGLEWLLRHATLPGRIAVAGLAALLLITNLVIPLPTASFGVTGAVRAQLSLIASEGKPSASVLYLPGDCTDVAQESVKLQYFHHHPVIGCEANFASIPWYSNFDLYARSAGLAALRCRPQIIGRRTTGFTTPVAITTALIDELRMGSLQLRYLLVDKPATSLPGCEHVSRELDFLRRYRVLAEDPHWLLIDLG